MFRNRVHKRLPVLVCVEKFVGDIVYNYIYIGIYAFAREIRASHFGYVFQLFCSWRKIPAFPPNTHVVCRWLWTWTMPIYDYIIYIYMAVTAISLQNVLCIHEPKLSFCPLHTIYMFLAIRVQSLSWFRPATWCLGNGKCFEWSRCYNQYRLPVQIVAVADCLFEHNLFYISHRIHVCYIWYHLPSIYPQC